MVSTGRNVGVDENFRRPDRPNPTELLSSKAMHAMLEPLAEDALVLVLVLVLVDAPPLLLVTDAAQLTASADGAIIVATAQKTTTDELSKALENLHQVHGNVPGVVLNRMPTTGADAGYCGYYGKSYYANSDKQAAPSPGHTNAADRSWAPPACRSRRHVSTTFRSGVRIH